MVNSAYNSLFKVAYAPETQVSQRLKALCSIQGSKLRRRSSISDSKAQIKENPLEQRLPCAGQGPLALEVWDRPSKLEACANDVAQHCKRRALWLVGVPAYEIKCRGLFTGVLCPTSLSN